MRGNREREEGIGESGATPRSCNACISGRTHAKSEGRLTRINDILSNLMEAERRIGSGR